jgi:hypothetical protein
MSIMDIRNFFARLKQGMHQNAATARSGFAAERRLCEDIVIKQKLESYFKKPIVSIQPVAGRKKSDVVVLFEDTTRAYIQNKNINGDGKHRGWSADRRAIHKFPLDETGKTLLTNVCLLHAGDRPDVPCPPTLIPDLLLGTDMLVRPTHFAHTAFHKETGELESMSIATADAVIASLQSVAYPTLLAKKTGVHISPLMYLQRKGGGKTDHAPDDIQLKLKCLPDSVMTHL